MNAVELKKMLTEIAHGLEMDGYEKPELPEYMMQQMDKDEPEKNPKSLESMFGGLYTKSLVSGDEAPWN